MCNFYGNEHIDSIIVAMALSPFISWTINWDSSYLICSYSLDIMFGLGLSIVFLCMCGMDSMLCVEFFGPLSVTRVQLY